MKRLIMGVVWFIIFWRGGLMLGGGVFGGFAGARMGGGPEAGYQAGLLAGQQFGQEFGGLILVLAAVAAVGGTILRRLPGTRKRS